MWVFYPPLVFAILILAVRHGGLRQLTASNPGMRNGGLIDLDKAKNLLSIQSALPDLVPKTALLPIEYQHPGELLDGVMAKLGLSFPIILKPNSGQRGLDVSIVSNRDEAIDYLETHKTETLLQEYVEGSEFGVFYMRLPNNPQGYVFSITHKQFPQLVGNGESTLEQLILEDRRAHYMASFLLKKHRDHINRVPEKGEYISLVDIGSHCRGSLFVDGGAYLTPALENRIDEISKAIPGYYFGRYDLRVPSIDHLQRAEGIKIIEANGLSSESTNIYDPSNSVFSAYKTLLRQWNMAFKISKQNVKQGAKISSYRELFSAWRSMNR